MSSLLFRLRSNALLFAGLLAAAVAACNGSPSTRTASVKLPPPLGDVNAADGTTERLGCMDFAKPGAEDVVRLEPVFEGLRLYGPTGLAQSAGDPEHWWLSDLNTGIHRFDAKDPAGSQELVLSLNDIGRTRIGTIYANELYSFALHPQFPARPYIYVYYLGYREGMTFPFDRRALLSRFTWDGARFDPLSEQNLLALVGPTADPDHEGEVSEHPGSIIGFDKAGKLLVAVGDLGIFPTDLHLRDLNPAQNLSLLGGKVLRLDIDAGEPYAIPVDNPFASSTCESGACPEIWAYGLRHPWRGSVDATTGEVWVGDVGWSTYEEINRIQRGANYGWPWLEAGLCNVVSPCVPEGTVITPPVVALGRDYAHSITGGYVYRGTQMPELLGKYVFADWVLGLIQQIDPAAADIEASHRIIAHTNRSIASMAQDLDGELYALHLPLPLGGAIYKLAAEQPSPRRLPSVPSKLSQTGCFLEGNPSEPGPALVPYDVRVPLWSDGASKHRWLSVPNGEHIEVEADGKLRLPVGTVLAKSFTVQNQLAEIRLFVHHDEETWQGYTYEWNADENDGTLVASGVDKDIGGQTWRFPGQWECAACHTAAAGYSLGLELAQLDRTNEDPFYGGSNQVERLRELGFFADGPLPSREPFPFFDDRSADVGHRARAYLHSNCSGCHRPGGPTPVDLDLRYDTPLSEMRVCEVNPVQTFGLEDARRVAPGAPERSVLLHRMKDSGWTRMPPIATFVPDAEGNAAVEQWIRSLSSCE